MVASPEMKQAAATMVQVLEPLRTEFESIKASLDSLTSKKDEVRASNLEQVKNETDSSRVDNLVENFVNAMESEIGTDASAEYVILFDRIKEWVEVISNLSNAYLDSLVNEATKATGSPETLRAKAKEIREKYEGLAASAKTLDPDVTIESLPVLSSRGRPKGSGKHQVNAAQFTITVNGVEQATTHLSTILTSHAKGLSVADFFKLLKASYPDYQHEYAGDWELELPNGKVIKGTRTESQVSE